MNHQKLIPEELLLNNQINNNHGRNWESYQRVFPGKTSGLGGYIGEFAQHFNKQASPNHKNISIQNEVFKLYLWSQQATYTITWQLRIITYYKLLLFVISM